MAEEGDGLLARWSRRKLQRDTPAEPPAPAVPQPAAAAALPQPAPPVAPPADPPAPTLDDVAALTPGAGVARFVARGVDPTVKNAALKKLFADPHFNVMDGLDTYIDDYGKPDPLPASMLRRMAQSQFLGLFRDEQQPPPGAAADNPPAAAAIPESDRPADEDADLRLQPDDAAGPGGTGAGAGEDAGRER
jgi:hypothetical protein